MLKRYAPFVVTMNFAVDLLATAVAFLAAYVARFHSGIPVWRGVPPLGEYLVALPVVLLVYAVVFRLHGLYRPRRLEAIWDEAGHVLRADLSGFLILAAISFVYREYSYSRLTAVLFFGLNFLLVFGARLVTRALLRRLRARGYNRRYALIVGAGREGQALLAALRRNVWTGIVAKGFLDDRDQLVGRTVEGVPVLGRTDQVASLVAQGGVDQVFVALPMEEYVAIRRVVESLVDSHLDIRIVSDLFGFTSLNRTVGDFDGLPIISLRESPLYGWKQIVKRLMDVGIAAVGLVLLSPVLLLIAIAIRLTSGPPVLHCQKRMGLDCRSFTMYKFRTMSPDAEAATGPVWAAPDDERVTSLGRFLRRYSLDELPQFVNVIKGDMSLVGPRPERPDFISDFNRQVPRYALRHKVKAGITGWAQVNDWRGDTSLRKRIEYDLYYIENWSITLDLRILLLTCVRVVRSRNAC